MGGSAMVHGSRHNGTGDAGARAADAGLRGRTQTTERWEDAEDGGGPKDKAEGDAQAVSGGGQEHRRRWSSARAEAAGSRSHTYLTMAHRRR